VQGEDCNSTRGTGTWCASFLGMQLSRFTRICFNPIVASPYAKKACLFSFKDSDVCICSLHFHARHSHAFVSVCVCHKRAQHAAHMDYLCPSWSNMMTTYSDAVLLNMLEGIQEENVYLPCRSACAYGCADVPNSTRH
jgi:hypothetical protein